MFIIFHILLFLIFYFKVMGLDDQQLKWLQRHMGHTERVHLQHYRATSGLIERIDIAKLMLLQEKIWLGDLLDFDWKISVLKVTTTHSDKVNLCSKINYFSTLLPPGASSVSQTHLVILCTQGSPTSNVVDPLTYRCTCILASYSVCHFFKASVTKRRGIGPIRTEISTYKIGKKLFIF